MERKIGEIFTLPDGRRVRDVYSISAQPPVKCCSGLYNRPAKARTPEPEKTKENFMMTMSEELKSLMTLFPMSFINSRVELILVPKENIYFLLEDVKTPKDLKRKVIEWVSRPSCKGTNKKTMQACLSAMNTFLGTNFTQEEMMEIYTRCGNGCNKARTERFIDSGYDLTVLARQDAAQ